VHSPDKCEYAIVAGIQIHGPGGENFFWPGQMTIHDGSGKRIDLREEYTNTANQWVKNLSDAPSKALNDTESLALLQKLGREACLAAERGELETLKRLAIPLGGVRDHAHRTLLHRTATRAFEEVPVQGIADPTVESGQNVPVGTQLLPTAPKGGAGTKAGPHSSVQGTDSGLTGFRASVLVVGTALLTTVALTWGAPLIFDSRDGGAAASHKQPRFRLPLFGRP